MTHTRTHHARRESTDGGRGTVPPSVQPAAPDALAWDVAACRAYQRDRLRRHLDLAATDDARAALREYLRWVDPGSAAGVP